MKRCTKCHFQYKLSDFPKNRTKPDGYSNICKQCNTENVKAFYKVNRNRYKHLVQERTKKYLIKVQNKVNSIKQERGCYFCDETQPCCLDFHHKNDKLYTIGALVRQKSWKKIETEIAKCIVVCSNCHRKLHKGIKLIPKHEMLKRLNNV